MVVVVFSINTYIASSFSLASVAASQRAAPRFIPSSVRVESVLKLILTGLWPVVHAAVTPFNVHEDFANARAANAALDYAVPSLHTSPVLV